MKTKTKPRRRLLAAFVAACMLLLTVPIIAVFADPDPSSGTPDVSTLTLKFDTGVRNTSYWQIADIQTLQYIPDQSSDDLSFTAPPAPTSEGNTFKYWKNSLTGAQYYAGQEYTINITELANTSSVEWNLNEFKEGRGSWQNDITAVWESDILQLIIPSDDAYMSFYVQGETPQDGTSYNWNNVNMNLSDPKDGAYWYQYNKTGFECQCAFSIEKGTFQFDDVHNTQTIPSDLGTPTNPLDAEDAFLGWSTRKDGSGTLYQAGQTFTLMSPRPTFFAVFNSQAESRNKITVVAEELMMLDNDDDLRNAGKDPEKDNKGRIYQTEVYTSENKIASFTAPPALHNELATMVSWYDRTYNRYFVPEQTYENVDISKFLTTEDDYYNDTYQMWLEAVWDKDVIAMDRYLFVFYDYEGSGNRYASINIKGTYNTKTGDIVCEPGTQYQIPTDHADPQRDGYDFDGWSLTEYGDKPIYKKGDYVPVTDRTGLDFYAVFSYNGEQIVEHQTGSRVVQVDIEPTPGLELSGGVTLDQLEIKVGDSNQEGQVRQALLQETNGDSYIMDISLFKKNTEDKVTVSSGKFKVKMSYPNQTADSKKYYRIFHYQDNGELEEIWGFSQTEDGFTFFADSFSPYVLVVEEGYVDPDDPGNTGTGGSDSSDTPSANDSSDSDSSASDTPADSAAQNATASEATPAVSKKLVTEKPDELVAQTADGKQVKAGDIIVYGNDVALNKKDAAKYIAMVKGDAESSDVYDITIRDKDGNILTLLPGQTVTVCIPRPAGSITSSLALFHINGDKAEPVKITKVTADHIEFEANGFSPYVLTWKAAKSTGDPDNPGTGESGYLSVILFAVAALGAFGAATYKKRKETVE